jgi:hypothetical protein
MEMKRHGKRLKSNGCLVMKTRGDQSVVVSEWALPKPKSHGKIVRPVFQVRKVYLKPLMILRDYSGWELPRPT